MRKKFFNKEPDLCHINNVVVERNITPAGLKCETVVGFLIASRQITKVSVCSEQNTQKIYNIYMIFFVYAMVITICANGLKSLCRRQSPLYERDQRQYIADVVPHPYIFLSHL